MEKLVAGGLLGLKLLEPKPEPQPEPQPEPVSEPEPTPAPPPESSRRIGELAWRVRKLEKHGGAVIKYLEDLHVRLEDYHREVSKILSTVGWIPTPVMPEIPLPPEFEVVPYERPGARKSKKVGAKTGKKGGKKEKGIGMRWTVS